MVVHIIALNLTVYIIYRLLLNHRRFDRKGFIYSTRFLLSPPQEPVVRLPSECQLQQPAGFGEEHCSEGAVHGRRGSQPGHACESPITPAPGSSHIVKAYSYEKTKNIWDYVSTSDTMSSSLG